VGFGVPEIRRYELIAPALGSLHDRGASLLRAVHHPVVELPGDVAQDVAADWILSAIGAEKTDHPFRLLKGLNYRVEQDAVEAPVAEGDTALVMLEKGGLHDPKMPGSLLHQRP